MIGRYCANCHMVDGEGGSVGPDLTRIGGRHDAAWLRDWITQPDAVDPAATCRRSARCSRPSEMTAIVNYLAARK